MTKAKAPNGRLREDTVRAIRARRGTVPATTYQAIAQEFGVSIGTVYNICTGKTWGWLP
jgi:DNA invertase Pin-like site-specific DNA recombinase